jgi:DNA-binding transcriptional regulator PaaX
MQFMARHVEAEAHKRVRITKVRRAILTSLAVVGVTALAIAMPNTLQLLDKPLNRINRRNIRTAMRDLVRKGLLRESGKGDLELTAKGRTYLDAVQLSTRRPRRPRVWDKQWRLVAFDIPERRAAYRRQLVLTLRNLGFYRLQDSIWVFPYDCEELITLIKADFRLGREVLYMIVVALEHDAALKRHFGL